MEGEAGTLPSPLPITHTHARTHTHTHTHAHAHTRAHPIHSAPPRRGVDRCARQRCRSDLSQRDGERIPLELFRTPAFLPPSTEYTKDSTHGAPGTVVAAAPPPAAGTAAAPAAAPAAPRVREPPLPLLPAGCASECELDVGEGLWRDPSDGKYYCSYCWQVRQGQCSTTEYRSPGLVSWLPRSRCAVLCGANVRARCAHRSGPAAALAAEWSGLVERTHTHTRARAHTHRYRPGTAVRAACCGRGGARGSAERLLCWAGMAGGVWRGA